MLTVPTLWFVGAGTQLKASLQVVPEAHGGFAEKIPLPVKLARAILRNDFGHVGRRDGVADRSGHGSEAVAELDGERSDACVERTGSVFELRVTGGAASRSAAGRSAARRHRAGDTASSRAAGRRSAGRRARFTVITGRRASRNGKRGDGNRNREGPRPDRRRFDRTRREAATARRLRGQSSRWHRNRHHRLRYNCSSARRRRRRC